MLSDNDFGIRLESEFQQGHITEYGWRGHVATVIFSGSSTRRYAQQDANGVWDVKGLGW